MSLVLEDFKKTFGEECLNECLNRAGCHSEEEVPGDDESKLLFSLLEILDYQCCIYKDAPADLTEENIKQFLLKHKEKTLEINPPSFIGLFCGVFSFLTDDKKEEN